MRSTDAHRDALGELLKAAFAVTTWGGRITCLSTHNGATAPMMVPPGDGMDHGSAWAYATEARASVGSRVAYEAAARGEPFMLPRRG